MKFLRSLTIAIVFAGILFGFVFFLTRSIHSTLDSDKEQVKVHPEKLVLATNLPTKQSPAKFCIKVVPFGDDWDDPYSIQFSRDGEVFEELLQVIDTQKYTGKSGMLLYQTLLERDKGKALKLAKGLKSYDDCLRFNEKVQRHYEALVAKYQKKPPKPHPMFAEPKYKPARTESIVYCE